ncbi:hypothetical protein Tco_1185027 [Tanacetum coccineum]
MIRFNLRRLRQGLTNIRTLPKDQDKQIHSSMSSRSNFGLGFGETFGSDEVFDPSGPSIFDTTLKMFAEKLSMTVFQAVGMHAVPLLYTRTISCLLPTILTLMIHNLPMVQKRPTSVPAVVRNRPTSVPAGSRNRPTSVPAGRPFTAGWKNHAARHMTRPSSHYFQHFSRPGYYNQMYMDEGRWGTAVKPSAGCLLGRIQSQICNGDPRTMENPHKNRDLGIVDSGCSRSMTGNKEKLDRQL